MNAMLDPRIVAASNHRPENLLRGAEAFADMITASSHGGFMTARAVFSR
jgi:hypothetical protein